MRIPMIPITTLTSVSLLLSALTPLSTAQTYSNCDPLNNATCPADSALGKSVSIDFTAGSSDSFTSQGNPKYSSNGASFTIAQEGDSPQLTSRWYIMFGHVEAVLKSAPGQGIVSSVVLQSDDLDEIDWEWLGGDPDHVQTNYFGKGITLSYNRGTFQNATGSQTGWHTYTFDWTADQIIWQVDGQTVRVLTPTTAEANQYPQTPMQLKLGAWAGGDPRNSAGTIAWAGGLTDYSNGPYTMQVQSVAVTDYSTGSSYSYTGTSGNWQDIVAQGGGKVNPTRALGSSVMATTAPAVLSTATAIGQPIPFQPTTLYSWQKSQTLSTVTFTNYPGLPSGWTVTSNGKVIPPANSAGRYRASIPWIVFISFITGASLIFCPVL